MTDFEIWFEINKVTSNRSPDMEGLKDLFEKCWNDSKDKTLENSYEVELKQEVVNLESYISELEDDVENLKGTIIEIKNKVEESKTLKEAKRRVKDYDY